MQLLQEIVKQLRSKKDKKQNQKKNKPWTLKVASVLLVLSNCGCLFQLQLVPMFGKLFGCCHQLKESFVERCSMLRSHSSTGLSIGRWSQEKPGLFRWSWSSHRSCKRCVFLSGTACPLVPFALPCRPASWNQQSATSWEHSQFLNQVPRSLESVVHIPGGIDFSSIHSTASVAERQLEQASSKITNVVEFGNFSNSILSASFFLVFSGTPHYSDYFA